MKIDHAFRIRRSLAVSAASLLAGLAACAVSAEPEPSPAPVAQVPHAPAGRAHPVYAPVAAAGRGAPYGTPPSSAFDFQRKSPIEFLEFLAVLEGEASATAFRPTVFAVHGIHVGWIRAEDLPALYAALDDERPCVSVVGTQSSVLRGVSTVGREAAFLIDGYHSEVELTGYGGYPPAIHSGFATPAAALMQNRTSTR